MSRIGKKPVPIGSAKVAISGKDVRVEGPKGKLQFTVHEKVQVTLNDADKELVVTRPDDEGSSRALHGLTRAILANMIQGVTAGYQKRLDIQGVGYKAEQKGKNIVLSVGFANTISVPIIEGVTVTLESPVKISITGADKQAVGQMAANIRGVRPPEPYKGKGIRYEGEQVKLKAGKAFTGAGSK